MGFFDGIAKSFGDVFQDVGGLAADALTGGGYSTMQANATNVHLNKENRDWSERMSNSAYQRAMDDMKKAGLNPMLAYQQGGASTPANTAPSITPAKMGAGIANNAMAAAGMISQQNNQKADTILKAESAETEKSKRDLNSTQALKNIANAKESDQASRTHQVNRLKTNSERYKNEEELPGIRAQSQSRTMDTQLQRERYSADKAAQKFDAIRERISNTIGDINSAKKIFSNQPSVNVNSYNPNKDVRDTLSKPFRRKN